MPRTGTGGTRGSLKGEGGTGDGGRRELFPLLQGRRRGGKGGPAPPGEGVSQSRHPGTEGNGGEGARRTSR